MTTTAMQEAFKRAQEQFKDSEPILHQFGPETFQRWDGDGYTEVTIERADATELQEESKR